MGSEIFAYFLEIRSKTRPRSSRSSSSNFAISAPPSHLHRPNSATLPRAPHPADSAPLLHPVFCGSDQVSRGKRAGQGEGKKQGKGNKRSGEKAALRALLHRSHFVTFIPSTLPRLSRAHHEKGRGNGVKGRSARGGLRANRVGFLGSDEAHANLLPPRLRQARRLGA